MILRALIYLALLLLFSIVPLNSVLAKQSKLPKCPNVSIPFNNCFGKVSDGKGKTYLGEWQNGRAEGQGTLTFADGTMYVGQFRDGHFEGEGIQTMVDGGRYVGHFHDNKFDGQGTITMEDGIKFVGQFQEDQFTGRGVSYSPDGTILAQGVFQNYKLIKSESTVAQPGSKGHRIQMAEDGGAPTRSRL